MRRGDLAFLRLRARSIAARSLSFGSADTEGGEVQFSFFSLRKMHTRKACRRPEAERARANQFKSRMAAGHAGRKMMALRMPGFIERGSVFSSIVPLVEKNYRSITVSYR